MVRAQLNLTRRAVLGAACAPLAGAAAARGPLHQPSAGPPPRTGEEREAGRGRGSRPGEDWERALGAVRAAEALVAEVEGATSGASLAEEEAWLPRHEAACARMETAVERAMGVAAPDLAAFAVKLDLLFAYGVEPGAFEEDWVAAIRKDARGLLRHGRVIAAG